MRFYLFIFFLILFGNCYSQNTNQIDVGSLAVLVQSGNGSGSGFYLTDSTKDYMCFVTASHVLVDPQTNQLYSDSILLISYKKNSQRDSRDSFRISLMSAYRMGMFRYNSQKDVAVLKIAITKNRAIIYQPFVTKITLSNTYLNQFEAHLIKKIGEVETMSDIFTVGYPKSLSLNVNFDYNRPLVRKGIIAGVDLQKDRIIADLPVYQGNSGGAVFQAILFNPNTYLIGIVSQFVPFEEHWINQAYGYFNTNVYNSGYAVIVPVDNILNEINQLK
ncbi:MAG: trypsin-like peptidase domain-containing protein [Bacteroidetes bacterium]|nr:trypsin-like peptidase domain-containing protein [Bacteroidota bacterium]